MMKYLNCNLGMNLSDYWDRGWGYRFEFLWVWLIGYS